MRGESIRIIGSEIERGSARRGEIGETVRARRVGAIELGVRWDIDLHDEGGVVRDGEEESEEIGGKCTSE